MSREIKNILIIFSCVTAFTRPCRSEVSQSEASQCEHALRVRELTWCVSLQTCGDDEEPSGPLRAETLGPDQLDPGPPLEGEQLPLSL